MNQFEALGVMGLIVLAVLGSACLVRRRLGRRRLRQHLDETVPLFFADTAERKGLLYSLFEKTLEGDEPVWTVSWGHHVVCPRPTDEETAAYWDAIIAARNETPEE